MYCLLQPLQREDEQLRVVLVGERREGDRREPARLEPVHGRRVDGDRLLGRDVRPVLEVVVLPLLLRLEVEPGEPAQVLAADGLVDGRAAPDALAVVVRDLRPPVRLLLDVAQDHRLDRARAGPGTFQGMLAFQQRHASERCCRMARALLALTPAGIASRMSCMTAARSSRSKCDSIALLGDGLARCPWTGAPRTGARAGCRASARAAARCRAGKRATRATWGPEADAGALADGARVEAVVDEVLQVLAHADLAHQLVLVAVHARQLPDVRERVLQAVRQLVRVHVAQPVLHVRVDHAASSGAAPRGTGGRRCRTATFSAPWSSAS